MNDSTLHIGLGLAGLALGSNTVDIFIYGEKSVQSGDETPTQNGHVDTQIEQASGKEDSQESSPVFSQQTGQRSFSPLRPHRTVT